MAVVGASGYVGRILTNYLASPGQRVVVIARKLDRLPAGRGIEARIADVGDPDATSRALAGVTTAYYLVHAMAGGDGFAERDRALARSFASAARSASLHRIVYLGGLGGQDTSEHLASRHEVGEILRKSGVPVVELRAAVILGAGSISFEMLRYLTERLPAMVCPRWVDTRIQPLAERDLLAYLDQAREVPPGVYEIGAPDVTTYHEMIGAYAAARGLKRRHVVKVPLLTPSLSAHWVDLVTPVDRSVSHALIESLRTEVVVRDASRTSAVFDVTPAPVAEAIRAALDEQAARVADGLLECEAGQRDGVYTIRSEAPLAPGRAETVRRDLANVGGDLRWYGLPWAWRLRMVLGRLVGERLELERPERPAQGVDADWWTIAHADANSLVLASRSWFFGEAWLGYRVEESPVAAGRRPTRIVQVAAFRPRGSPGLAYWRLLLPVHWIVFRLMARRRSGRREL